MEKKPVNRAWLIVCAGVLLALGACTEKSTQSLLADGKAAVAKKDYRAAVIQFKAALQDEPNSPELRYLLGQALLDAGDPVAAAVELGKANEQKYAPDKVVPILAQALLLTGEPRKLVNLYADTTLADRPAQAALKAALATAWASLGEKEKTMAAIKAALEAEPDFAPARLMEARVTAGTGAYTEALAQIDRILARDGARADVWMLKGDVQTHLKDQTGAEASFRKALAIQPAFVPAHMALLNAMLRRNDIAAAKAQLESLKSATPKHPATVYAEAQIAFAEKQLDKARELAQQLLRIAPSDTSALLLAGAIEGSMGSLVLAESHFTKALQSDPSQITPRLNLALIYLNLGQPAQALKTLQPALEGRAESAQAHALAGDAELRQSNASAAEAHFRRAAAMDPDNSRVAVALALTSLAKTDANSIFAELNTLSARSKDLLADQAIVSARLRRGEYDEALKAVDVMARKRPDDASVFELRGRIQKSRGDLPAARAAFERALKLDPSLYSATASLASMDIVAQKPEAARKRYEESIAADPKNYFARMALAALQRRTGAKLDDVKATLGEAIKATPGAAAPRMMLIDLLLRERQTKDALAQARDATATLPNDVAMIETAARVQALAGEIEQSLNTYRRLTNMMPGSASPWLSLAGLYRASGRADSAEAALRKAVEVEPRSIPAQAALIDFLMSSKRAPDALELARAQQRQRPKEAPGYIFEASLQLRQQQPDAAIATLRRGLAAAGNNSELARALFGAQFEGGRAADADRFATSWLKANPDDNAFDYHVALAEISQGDLAKADVRLARVSAALPENALVMNSRAWVLAKLGKPGALALAQRSVDTLPDRPESMDTLAYALAADKQYPLALQTQQRAIELAPSNNELRLNLARIALQAGDKSLAKRELEALKAMGATFALQDEVAKLMKSL